MRIHGRGTGGVRAVLRIRHTTVGGVTRVASRRATTDRTAPRTWATTRESRHHTHAHTHDRHTAPRTTPHRHSNAPRANGIQRPAPAPRAPPRAPASPAHVHRARRQTTSTKTKHTTRPKYARKTTRGSIIYWGLAGSPLYSMHGVVVGIGVGQTIVAKGLTLRCRVQRRERRVILRWRRH
jgi:hypothetical protein